MKTTKVEIYLLTLGSAAVMSYVTNLNELNGDEWVNWTWVGWSRFFGTIAVQVFIAWKALVTTIPVEPNPDHETIRRTIKVEETNAAQEGEKPKDDKP